MFNHPVPTGWVDCFLKDAIARVVGGGTPSRTVPAYWNGDISWASVKDFKDETQYLHNTEEYISSLGLLNSAANLIEAGVPLICTRMAVGRAAIPTKPVAINQDLKAVYTYNQLSNRYLLLLLNFIRPSLESLSIGSTVKGITISQLLTIPVILPPLLEQQKIAEIFDAIDKAIALTDTHITKLKKAKAGLLHDLLTRGIDEHGELRDYTRNPELFKRSLLGIIPKDWDAKPLSSIANLQVGYAFKSQCFQENEGIRLIRGENVGYGRPDWSDTKRLPWDMYRQYKEYELSEGDIIIGMDRTFTKSGCKISVLDSDDIPSLLVQRVGRFIAHSCNLDFLKVLLISDKYQLYLQLQQKGMDIPHLSQSEILEPIVPIPLPKEQVKIAQLIANHEIYVQYKKVYLEKLKLLKKGLMSDLLTGRVRVKI